jgi:hypothetical protein
MLELWVNSLSLIFVLYNFTRKKRGNAEILIYSIYLNKIFQKS